MAENRGQEHRAFMAILLAMGVLFAWNYFFPVTPPPPPQEGDQPVVQRTEGMRDATEPAPSPVSTPAAAPSAPVTGTTLGLQHLGGGGLAMDSTAVDAPAQRITVETEDLVLTFDSVGARLVRVELPKFDEAGNGLVQLLPENGPGALASVVAQGDRHFPLDGFPYRLVSDNTVTEGRRLTFELALQELVLRKSYTVPPAGHLITVSHELVQDQAGVSGWGLSWAGGLAVTEEIMGSTRGSYFHGTVKAEGEVKRKDPNSAKEPLEFPGTTFFAGVQNKYFLGAIVPRGENQGPSRLWRIAGEDDQPTMAAEILVERTPGLAASQVDYDVYVGPLDYANLKELGLGLEETVDLGASWIRPLSRLILSLLIGLHAVIPNYGFTIILFSAAMNLLFFPLTFKSTKSMRDMSALKPQLDALKEKYKDEPQKMSEATMRLYKEAGVNPMAGCLPILLQMPIFFALYAVLFHTIELRQEPFLLWVRDLSQPDVVFNLPFSLPLIGSGICLLPIIMGVTSFFQSKQTMVDPNQKAMLYMMPVMMTFIFFTMPSGLVLYWLTSNLFTIGTKFFMKPTPNIADVTIDDDDDKGKKGPRSKGRAKRPAKAGAK